MISFNGARMDTVYLSKKAVTGTVNQRIFGVQRTG
jgi:hypothetical protein